jgi:Mrp family chromosome partitioning ATPase
LAACVENGSNPLSATISLEPLGCLLRSGNVDINSTELLETKVLSSVIQRLSAHFDWILVDSPPVLPLTDTLFKQPADGSLLMVRPGNTPEARRPGSNNALGPHQ